MSRENVETVRYPLSVRATSRRRPVERLTVRFPGAVALGGRAIQRLPPRSALRQKLVRQAGRIFLEAYNHRDFESTYSLYHPHAETVIPDQLVGVGFERVERGDRAPLRVQQRWHAEWGEFRIEPEEIVDFGGRFLLLGKITGSGLSSGAGMVTEWGNLVTMEAGRIIREQLFFDRAEALNAAGLPE